MDMKTLFHSTRQVILILILGFLSACGGGGGGVPAGNPGNTGNTTVKASHFVATGNSRVQVSDGNTYKTVKQAHHEEDLVKDFAADNDNNRLYGISHTHLYTIDTDTGLKITQGEAKDFRDINGIAYVKSKNTLYAVNPRTKQVLTINPDTAEMAVVSNVEEKFKYLAYDSQNEILYGYGINDAVALNGIYEINVNTGSTRLIGVVTMEFSGLEFYNGRLIAIEQSSNKIYNIDTASIVVSDSGDTFNIFGVDSYLLTGLAALNSNLYSTNIILLDTVVKSENGGRVLEPGILKSGAGVVSVSLTHIAEDGFVYAISRRNSTSVSRFQKIDTFSGRTINISDIGDFWIRNPVLHPYTNNIYAVANNDRIIEINSETGVATDFVMQPQDISFSDLFTVSQYPDYLFILDSTATPALIKYINLRRVSDGVRGFPVGITEDIHSIYYDDAISRKTYGRCTNRINNTSQVYRCVIDFVSGAVTVDSDQNIQYPNSDYLTEKSNLYSHIFSIPRREIIGILPSRVGRDRGLAIRKKDGEFPLTVADVRPENIKAMTYDESSKTVYAIDSVGGELVKFDVDSLKSEKWKSVRVQGGPSIKDNINAIAFNEVQNLIYAISDSTAGQDMLSVIDPATGHTNDIGRTGYSDIQGLHYDNLNQVLYGVDNYTDHLVVVDTENPLNSYAVGPLGVADIKGLSEKNGELFGVGNQGIYRIDKVTGNAVKVADTEISGESFVYIP